MSIITGAWKNIKFVCGMHSESVHEMQLFSTARTFCYRCPMGDPLKHRHEDEKICNNMISLNDYEKAIEHISKKLADADDNDETLCLRYYKWKRKELSFEIIEHCNDHIVVKVINATKKQ